jgi:hypothetical protein
MNHISKKHNKIISPSINLKNEAQIRNCQTPMGSHHILHPFSINVKTIGIYKIANINYEQRKQQHLRHHQ